MLARAHLVTGSWLGLSLRLVAAMLRAARKQQAVLKDASLLAPDMVSEFEEQQLLVRQQAGVSLEQAPSPKGAAEVGEAAPAPEMMQGCDGEDLGSCPLSFALVCAGGAGGGWDTAPGRGCSAGR